MNVRNQDWKWLRTATLDHNGFLPGMPWITCATAFERLLEDGLVRRHEVPARHSSRIYIRAVITPAGQDALARHGAATLAYLASQEAPTTPAVEDEDLTHGR